MSRLKIFGITHIKDFFEAVEACKGKVEIVTEAGDRLNLRSKLCQYVAMSEIFKDTSIGTIELELEYSEDMSRILAFIMTED